MILRLMMGLFTCVCVLGLCASAQERAPREIELTRDVVYGTGDDIDLHLDIARPKDITTPLPCVVVIHGGGWRAGDKSNHIGHIEAFARDGFVSATIQYRFCPKFKFPAQVEDVKCAVRYLRANAKEYGIDADHIGAVGFSAGAHLSMMLGTLDASDGIEGAGGSADESSKVQAVVAFYGPTLFTADDMPAPTTPLVADFLGGTLAEKPDVYRAASPLTYVNPGDAAMLLFQGTEDLLVPYTQAVAMISAMTKANVPGRVEFLIDAGHGWGGAEGDRTASETLRFFTQHLKKP